MVDRITNAEAIRQYKEQIITGSDIEIYAKLKQQFEEASGNVENYTKSIRSAISKGRKKGTFAFNKNAKTTNESTGKIKWISFLSAVISFT